MIEPFLKGVGSKRKLREHLLRVLPSGARLVEPFVGSGAVFGATDYPAFLLADKNAELINVYRQLLAHGDSFITDCCRLFGPRTNSEAAYYDLRLTFNGCPDPYRRAALFVYLNRHCFNGLWRVNKSGKFNVSFGQYRAPSLPVEGMRAFYALMVAKQPILRAQDYTTTLAQCQPGDVVYLDPPYAPKSATANFAGYCEGGFTARDHTLLAQWARELQGAGISVVISNHDNDYTRRLYEGAEIESVFVRHSVAAAGEKRGPTAELTACFYAVAAGSHASVSSSRGAVRMPKASGTMSA